MISNANQGIKNSILMHVIIFLSVYISLYEKVIIISKCINLGLIVINEEEYICNPSLLEIMISC